MELATPFDKAIVPGAYDFSTTFNASRKLLSCYLCDKTFQNAADYTAHSLSAHNNSTVKKLLEKKTEMCFKKN